MAGRGNILEVLKRKKLEEEQRAREEEELQRLRDEEARKANTVKPSFTVGRGRGLIQLDKLRSPSHQDDSTDSTSSGFASNGTSSSSSQSGGGGGGGGRGKLLDLLKKIKPVVLNNQVNGHPETNGYSNVNGHATTNGHSELNEGLQNLNLSYAESSSSEVSTGRSSMSSEPEPVCRQGSSGKEVHLTGNYIFVKLDEDKTIHQYEVKFDPELDMRSHLRQKLLNQHIKALGGVRTFDGMLLHLPMKLPDKITKFQSVHPADNSIVELSVIYKRPIPMKENISFFNLLMNRVLKELRLVRIGKHDFNPNDPYMFPQHKLEVWPGYITSISMLEGGLLLNLDATHRVMRQDTVLDLMGEIYETDHKNMKQKVLNEVLGCSVLTRYNNRTYKVDDIDWDKNPQYEFPYKGSSISLVQYYKTQHNAEIKDLRQPLLVHRSKRKDQNGHTKEETCLLVPELCFLCGMTDSIRQDWKVMRDLDQKTKVSPQTRRQIILNFISEVKKNDTTRKIFEDWGLHFESDTVHISGRTLQPENIYFGKDNILKGSEKADWKKEIGRKPVLRTPNMRRWAVIFDKRARTQAEDFIDEMLKVCRSISMKIDPPKKVILANDRVESYTTELRNTITPDLEMVVVILRSNRSDYYNAIKKMCCTEMICPSQVILQKTLDRRDKLKAIVEKIALQINCKLGGALWSIKNPFSNVMVVGMDVYHAGTGSSTKGSVSAFVSSLDRDLSEWHSKVCLQKPRQEMVDLLRVCFTSALNVYRQKNNQYPDRIIVYRDGVGDGDFNVVRNYEIKQFIEACEEIADGYKPKMTFVIVQKRVNTRIFEKKNQLFNPGPGTIVDSVITRRFLYDFYLVPQLVNQGTVTPTHYVVLHDGANIPTDHLQRFTFKLCHLYYNWPGTIRVPAPCQYAHKLAYLVGQSVKSEPDPSLANTLYYL